MTDFDRVELHALNQLQAEALLCSPTPQEFPNVLLDLMLQRISDLEKEQELAA